MKDYTIGLDIGTNSVGWAVLTEDYQLVKKKMKVLGNTETKAIKKNFWGVRLFEEGQTAETRRLKRTARRRYTRRKNRIKWLQDLFRSEMKPVDENFFYRLRDSFFVAEDKEWEKHPFFATLEEEVAFHEEFPTIYHLRKRLIESDKKADLRLVYLALAHIIKFRGHFLIEGELNTENSSVEETFKIFLQAYNRTFTTQIDGSLINPLNETVEIGEFATEKISRAKKAERIVQLFAGEKNTGNFAQFVKLIVGNQGNFKKVFTLEEDEKLQFSKEEYEENLEALLAKIGDEYADVFVAAKNAYDAIELSNILRVSDPTSKAKLSTSMIERYENHKTDLEKFKLFVKQELPEKYYEIFRDNTKDGYAGYIEGKTTQEVFYKKTRSLIEKVNGSEYFVAKIEQEDFLRKQRTFDNGVIPHQIHLEELRAIIQKQGPFYPFLLEQKAKIEALLTFRIPYYVGPLANENSEFAWLTRKNEEAIRPWNLGDTVDLGKSATSFIERMTNYDLYLPEEKVLPKHSLVYEKYAVFNELTGITYLDERGNTHKLSSTEKKAIFNQFFKTKRKVSQKDIENYLLNESNMDEVIVSGIENKFNASYGTYQDFIKMGVSKELLDAEENEAMFEEIVKILTIFEDRKMIRQQLESYAEIFSSEVLKKLERRHYTGWGRLSNKLINEIRDSESHQTILDYLMDDERNRNFMQLINDNNLSFKEKIANAQQIETVDNLTDIVQNLAGSPAIKKGILQSLKIVEEIVTIMGRNPRKIVVEMARENQTTGRGRSNSKPRLKSLETAMQELGSKLLKEHPIGNQELQNDRLYLYYLQNGKDMYTGEDLDINNLSNYDIDHIIPQSFTTDNSIDNRVLTSSSANRGKSDDVPSVEIVNKMQGFWTHLEKSKLISERKLNNLTKAQRGGLTDEDKAGFIKRQLVETRQITKHVARILDAQFNANQDESGKTIRDVRIITLKSALTSQFRKQFNLYKVREINDYHHAHDAYLNGVVANTLLKVYPQLEPEFVYGEYKKFNAFKENKATAKKQFYTNIMKFFAKDEPIVSGDGEILWDTKYLATIKKVMAYRQMNIVKKTEVQKGGFSKESILPKGESNKLIARKQGWDTAKYGGFDSPIVAYSVVFSYEKGKNKKIVDKIEGIKIMETAAFEKDSIQFLETKGYMNPKIKAKLPKYTMYETNAGVRRLVASASEVQKGNQIVLPAHLVELLYHANRCKDDQHDSLAYVSENKEKFSEVLVNIQLFAKKYINAEKNLSTIQNLFEKNFENGEIKELAQSFVNLMQFTTMGAPADFKFFEVNIPRKRYTSVTELLESTIINQSITGLYETRIKIGD